MAGEVTSIPYKYRARLLKIIDGDTLEVEIDLGMLVFHRTRLRLLGINTPETFGVKKDSAEYLAGMEAKNKLQGLLGITIAMQSTIIVETIKDKTEKYGRYLANVYALEDTVSQQWICINDKMKEYGYGIT